MVSVPWPSTGLRVVVLAALVAAPLASLAPEAASQAPAVLEYTVDAQDPALLAQGKALVTWRLSGIRDRITAVCLQVDTHEYAIDTGTFGPRAPSGPWVYHPSPSEVDEEHGKPACHEGFRALAAGVDSVEARFAMDVRRPAFSPCRCEFNSYLGPDWGVVKAESLAIPFSYNYYEPKPAFTARVRFQLPPGWDAEAPWARTGPQEFALPPGGDPLPRGFMALGRFTPEPHRSPGVGKEFVYVRLAQELRDKDSLFDYLEKATPYYQSVYGNATGGRILVISAGPPMFTGGLGSTDSLFVHQNSSRETIAHEFAHVWQRFQTDDVEGQSSIWVNEGDADLHGALSRFVTETQPGFTLQRLNEQFRASYDQFSGNPEFQQPLTSAAYGGVHEQVAYKKGLFVLLFLDSELKRLTDDAVGLNEVLRALNQEWDRTAAERTGQQQRMGNEEVLGVVNRTLQRHTNVDLRNFWSSYVYGTRWPPYRDVPQEAPVVFDRLEVKPPQVEAGGTITASVIATNVRSSTEARTVQLLVDGKPVANRSVTLRGQESAVLTFTAPGGSPGDHTARVAYLSADYRVLTAPDLLVEGVTPLSPPQAGVAFTLGVDVRNLGESPARATVEVAVGGQRRSGEVQVSGLGTARAALPFLVPEEGTFPAEVLVQWGGQSQTGSSTLTVGPRDRDNDACPDARDAFPDNPRLCEGGPVNDVRNSVPGAPTLAAILLSVLLAARRRRKPTRSQSSGKLYK